MPIVRTAYAHYSYVRETFASTLSQTSFEIEHYYSYETMRKTKAKDIASFGPYTVIFHDFITRDGMHAVLMYWPTLNSYTVMLPDGHDVAPRIPISNITN